MIPHKCTRPCEPEEGIHCLPDRGYPEWTIEQWRDVIKRKRLPLVVLRVQREDDITPAMLHSVIRHARENGFELGTIEEEPDRVGFLVWLKDQGE